MRKQRRPSTRWTWTLCAAAACVVWLCETLLLAPRGDDFVPPRRRAHELPPESGFRSSAPSAEPTARADDDRGAALVLARIFTVQRDETQLLDDWLRRESARARGTRYSRREEIERARAPRHRCS